jgi:hypothetical protein
MIYVQYIEAIDLVLIVKTLINISITP